MPDIALCIIPDDDPIDPRENDNLGTMACWHGRYKLGDEQPDVRPTEHALKLIEEDNPDFEESIAHLGQEFLDRAIWDVFEDKFYYLPLYLYDHSGITISTGRFSCPWDSGQVGFIYVPIDEAQAEFKDLKFPFKAGEDKLFQNLQEYVEHILRCEVEEYDSFIRGDMYGFQLMNLDSDEVLDTCFGFIGRDYKTNGMLEHISPDDLACISRVHFMEPTTYIRMEPREVEDFELPYHMAKSQQETG